MVPALRANTQHIDFFIDKQQYIVIIYRYSSLAVGSLHRSASTSCEVVRQVGVSRCSGAGRKAVIVGNPFRLACTAL